MTDLLQVLIPAVLGLAGTCAGAIFVHRRWKAERVLMQEAEYRRERRDAYKELWNRLEEIHIASRRSDLTEHEFSAVLLDLNSFILKADVYFESGIHSLANAYANTVRSLHAQVRQSGDAVAAKASSDTAIIPWETVQAAKDLWAFGQEADELRSSLRQRVEAVLKT